MILNQVNLEQLFTPIIAAGIVSLVVWIFRTKTEETKDRIDARQEEIKQIQDQQNNVRERLAVLEKENQNKEQVLIELKNALKEQKLEFQQQFSQLHSQLKEILTELMKKP